MIEQTVFCWSCGKACASARVICGHEDEYGRFQDASEMWLCDKCFYKRAESGEWKIVGKTQCQILVDCSMQSCASCGIIAVSCQVGRGIKTTPSGALGSGWMA